MYRIGYAMMYNTWQLNNVKFGGATAFPALGISAKPIKGSAIFWYLTHRNGREHPAFVHAGCKLVELTLLYY